MEIKISDGIEIFCLSEIFKIRRKTENNAIVKVCV
jgi:hypothetical protein